MYLGFAIAPLNTVPGDAKGSRRGGELNSKTQRPMSASAQQTSPDRQTNSCDWTSFLPLYPNACTLCWEFFPINRACFQKLAFTWCFTQTPFLAMSLLP